MTALPSGGFAMSVRILVVDDDLTIRQLLRRLLEDHSDWDVCGEAADGLEALSKTSQLSPNLVVMDLAMPRMNGIEAARHISAHHPEMPMLLLTVQQVSNELARQARHAGFRGAVSKETGGEVVKGVEALLQNETFFSTTGSDWTPSPTEIT
jgi:DNA-binding NarL/FixJ family response regulator